MKLIFTFLKYLFKERNRLDIKVIVKEYLADHGIQKKYFAKCIGVSPVVLSHWFAGRTVFNEKKMNLIHEFINS